MYIFTRVKLTILSAVGKMRRVNKLFLFAIDVSWYSSSHLFVVQKFTIQRVNKSGAIFDMTKLR